MVPIARSFDPIAQVSEAAVARVSAVLDGCVAGAGALCGPEGVRVFISAAGALSELCGVVS
jgi:hypothetical protein